MKMNKESPINAKKINSYDINSIHSLKEGVTKRLLEKYKPKRGLVSIKDKRINSEQKKAA
tara:strand:- start:233 stop:412 length:180 start_codon:yes stop_codon:yes gene_type:complete